mgnify:CR=1 FL=1
MLNRHLLHKFTVPALRWLLGGLFIWAGAVKLADPKAFARSIDAFGLVPEVLLPPVAVALPVLELLVGVAVVRRWRGGLAGMAALLLLFIGVLGYAMGQQLDVDCGCFSVAEQQGHTSVRTAFWRDLLMLAALMAVAFVDRRIKSVNPGALPPSYANEENVT